MLAASATVGPRYAARLFALATAEPLSAPGAMLDPLTFEVDPRTRGSETVEAGFCFRGKRLSAEPWFPVPWPILEPPDVGQLTRAACDAEYEALPDARSGERFRWHAYPPDQEAYEGFVRYALRRAGQLDPADGPSVPFVSGLEGGLDVRTTIRFWHADQIYVRQHRPTSDSIRNGVIDWTNRTEDSEILRGGSYPGGTIPIRPRSAACRARSGTRRSTRQGQAAVTRRRREWSFVTLDHPTFETRPGSGALWDRVIEPLVVFGQGDDVYDWLELVFRFCEGKPFVYYSQYTPSARIYALARSHKVRMRWCPLGHLSGALVARHRYWRQLWLADSQWRALKGAPGPQVGRAAHDPRGGALRSGAHRSSGTRAHRSRKVVGQTD